MITRAVNTTEFMQLTSAYVFSSIYKLRLKLVETYSVNGIAKALCGGTLPICRLMLSYKPAFHYLVFIFLPNISRKPGKFSAVLFGFFFGLVDSGFNQMNYIFFMKYSVSLPALNILSTR
ncbi:hypothetical protein XarbCFBP7614_15485 [Xanthomonas arboricola]|nr:hypothetical protein XarbCFBP7614_15485 [Xanthomonas arboricola]